MESFNKITLTKKNIFLLVFSKKKKKKKKKFIKLRFENHKRIIFVNCKVIK